MGIYYLSINFFEKVLFYYIYLSEHDGIQLFSYIECNNSPTVCYSLLYFLKSLLGTIRKYASM